jgi:hypothetical protein
MPDRPNELTDQPRIARSTSSWEHHVHFPLPPSLAREVGMNSGTWQREETVKHPAAGIEQVGFRLPPVYSGYVRVRHQKVAH